MNNDKFNTTKTDSTTGQKKSSLRDKVGSVVEKAGHKISDAGATGVGQKIHDLGDKIEKSHKDPNHPHDV